VDNITKRWRKGNHGGIPISRNLNLGTLLFADDQVIVAQNEDDLQRAVYYLQVTASEFNMSTSTEKTKFMAFAGKEPDKSKICVNGKILEQVNTFNYLGCALSYEGEKRHGSEKIKICKSNRCNKQRFQTLINTKTHQTSSL
jgi:hypothetical protein